MRKRTATYCAVVAGAVAVTSNPAIADPPFFSRISDPNMGIHDTNGISADGTTVVGMSQTLGLFDHQPFRWTMPGGFERLGYLAGSNQAIPISVAEGVNDDGSVVVGRCYMPNEAYLAFRWTLATGMVSLGELPGGHVSSEARGTNADGTVVVGSSSSSRGIEAFRWTQGAGMQGLGALPGPEFRSFAHSVSADGTVVVGNSEPIIDEERAFRWTQSSGMVSLGTLPGGTASWAFDVSADGTTIVGRSTHAEGFRAFRWTSATGMQDLGHLPGAHRSVARGVSADGSVVVGESFAQGGEWRSFVWTEATGMVDVREFLLASGVTSVAGWGLIAHDVSADGRTLVGMSDNLGTGQWGGWIAHLGNAVCYPDCDTSTGVGVLDVFDFLCFQNSFVGGETYACDCDTSTGNGVCDVFDFLCFQNAFVGGCP